ncbi:MAG: LD-carboxypeptidase [Deltaproteobacteria bacterium]|nr:LD-carboxypeptidase [Deltaproteobacteria bacterium]
MSIRPPRLKPGDGIGIIAPAGPVTPSELTPGINLLISMGYDVQVSNHLYDQMHYLAGDDDSRSEDLHTMFGDQYIKAIFCARGGYGTSRLLDKIDYHLVRDNPKIIMGYSDITALLLALYKETGLVTFHGPMVRELSQGQDPDLIFGPFVSSASIVLDLASGTTLVPGRADGILLGGNLSLICHLVGTPFLPSLHNVVLFVEDKGESLYRIDRMLTHLRLTGLLNDLAGLIMGQFEDCGDLQTLERLFTDLGDVLNIPVCSGLPAGHGQKNITIPMGLPVALDSINLKLAIQGCCVSG